MANVNVLITGANRGIGKGLVETYLARPHHTVIAATRDPEHHTSKSLAEITSKGEGSRLIVVKIDSLSETDAAAAVEYLTAHEGIQHLDIVIANAGVSYIWPTVAEVKTDDLLAHFKPNVFGIIYLYQATRQLLSKAANPKWVTIGSNAGVLQVSNYQNQAPVPNAAYGPTKAAAHWLTQRINGEDEKLIAFAVHPGFVQTDLGNRAAYLLGLEEAHISVKESVDGVVPIIDKATKEGTTGRLWDYTGVPIAW